MTEAPRDDCCVDPRIPAHFDQEAREVSEDGALPEMQPVSERLYDQLRDGAEAHPSLLEVGCGTGALTVALLSSGLARADAIDLSAGSVAAARRRAEAAGVADRAQFQVGDGARLALTRHDWVVLDRVMCCYPNVERLLANAMSAADSRFAFTVPNSRGWRGLVIKVMVAIDVLLFPFQRVPCRGYVHSLDVIEGRLGQAGFALRSRTVGYWYTAVYERPLPEAS